MEDLSALRKKIYTANTQRNTLLQNIMRAKPFIAAQVYERYKKCGNPNCKCQKGELHGPYLWIYQNKKGQKILSTTVQKGKHLEAKELADNYKELLERRQKLRELDQKINEYLNVMESILEKEAKDYATKRHPGRPKKDR